MFSDRLTEALLSICELRNLSYEAASELCDISPRHFGDIIRKDAAPTITVLEKMCAAFHVTPNDLLGYSGIPDDEEKDIAEVKEAYCFHLQYLFIGRVARLQVFSRIVFGRLELAHRNPLQVHLRIHRIPPFLVEPSCGLELQTGCLQSSCSAS